VYFHDFGAVGHVGSLHDITGGSSEPAIIAGRTTGGASRVRVSGAIRTIIAGCVTAASTERVSIDLALAAEGAALAEALALPTVEQLVYLAIHETDFLGDLCDDLSLLETNVANSVDVAADLHSDRNGYVTVPLSLIVAAREALLVEAQDMLTDRAQAAADALYDAHQAGDLDHDGSAISYPRYRSV
jgi:hypothetical protein